MHEGLGGYKDQYSFLVVISPSFTVAIWHHRSPAEPLGGGAALLPLQVAVTCLYQTGCHCQREMTTLSGLEWPQEHVMGSSAKVLPELCEGAVFRTQLWTYFISVEFIMVIHKYGLSSTQGFPS